MDEDEQQQRDELLALESIFGADDGAFYYEQSEETAGSCFRGHVSVDAVPSSPIHLSATVAGRLEQCDVTYLPSVVLSFQLPRSYPSTQPPQFDISAFWLNSTLNSSLRQRLLEAWEENCGMPILFLWSQLLQEELRSALPERLSLDSLALPRRRRRSSSGKGAAVARQQSSSGGGVAYTAAELFYLLADADRLASRRAFERESHLCCVCFEERPGVCCVQFTPCLHGFCRQCVGGYFSVKIVEGTVRQLGCLADGCDSAATPELVRDAVTEERLYERYESLLLMQTLDLMSDVVSCPRPSCQRPVLLDAAGASGEAATRVGTCVECSFSFCYNCRRVFHGVAPCVLSNQQRRQIVAEYQAGSADLRNMLELRYGRPALQRILNESLAEEWIEENSKNCPHCRVHIEKRDGCNKMWCTKCGCAFCWLCLTVLDKQNPYAHFNSPANGACYNQLFFGVAADDDDDSDNEWR